MKILFFLSLLAICSACNKNRTSPHLKDCTNLEAFKILTETEKQNACHYLDVYLYQSAIYTICECCVCDKAPPIVDCEGNILENISYSEFYEASEYLFAVQESQ